MNSILISFFVSLAFTLLIIRTQPFHNHFSGDHDLDGPQKMHITSVPRVGGIGILMGVTLAIVYKLFTSSAPLNISALLCCAYVPFLIGLAEDISKQLSIKSRMLLLSIAALIGIITLNARILTIDIPIIDLALSFPLISLILTIFSLVGITNSYNIIDGFNGLASMVGILALSSIALVSYTLHDQLLFQAAIIMIAALIGFFIWNYPRGLIFLGDGGAYLVGYWIGILSILLPLRNPTISPWFPVLINAYPIFETLFSIYRRKIHRGKSPGTPDGIHFHTLIYRRVLNSGAPQSAELNPAIRNAQTAPYLWLLSITAIVPAILKPESSIILFSCFSFFALFYVWLYKRIVHFKTPKILHINMK